MSTFLLRLTGAALALIGLVAIAVSGWFLAAVGTSGTATFTAEPDSRVVVLDPDVINRVDEPVEVTAEGDGTLWAGATRPSDAKAYLDGGRHAGVSDISLADWTMTTSTSGRGQPRDADRVDIWHTSRTGKGSVSTTIEQGEAAQALVISAPAQEKIDEVQLSVTEPGWGATALAVLVGGVIVLLVGIAVLVRSSRPVSPHRHVPRRAAPRRASKGTRGPPRGEEAHT